MSAENEFQKLIEHLEVSNGGIAGQMFGKKCIKVNGKAAVALFQECLVFKLPETTHKEAMVLSGSILWDPSGKGRAMKEWVQVSIDHNARFIEFADSAAEYVS